MEMLDLDSTLLDYSLILRTPKKFLEHHKILPIEESSIYLIIGIVDKDANHHTLQELFKKPLKFLPISWYQHRFELLHLEQKTKLYHLAKQSLASQKETKIEHTSFVADFLETLLRFAIDLRSSDIHIEALRNGVIFRLRIDGTMVQIIRLQSEFYPIISATIKLLAKLDISQKRLPQNGRFSKKFKDQAFDFRVSFLPILQGESIVLRILDNNKAFLGLKNIGFQPSIIDTILKNITVSHGMILITGATGSGKTTTMYSILAELDWKKKKIITIEDPIEYNIDGVMQVPINEEIGYTFEVVLKNILRQDPDVIMIGEIRDENSLKIAMQAALTGHLVIATLHTNDAIKTINRLLDLGAKPYLIASVLRLIVSQKLIRVLCPHCKKEGEHDGHVIYEKNGCPHCNLQGYSGRTIITEHFSFDEKIARMVTNKEDIFEILSYANYEKISQNCYNKVLEGITSLEEFYLHEL